MGWGSEGEGEDARVAFLRHPRRLGIFGGTFDPIHLGHLVIAERARSDLALDLLLFVVAGDPPHKQSVVASAQDRLRMVQLATRDNPCFAVSDIEVRRAGHSYTVDTLRELREDRPRADFFFLLGSDSLSDLPAWHVPEDIAALATLAVVPRPGWESGGYEGLGSVVLVNCPQLDISSSAVRAMFRSGHSARYLVPDPVLEYVAERGLYR